MYILKSIYRPAAQTDYLYNFLPSEYREQYLDNHIYIYLFLIPACELKVFPKDKYHKNYYNLRLYYYPYQKR